MEPSRVSSCAESKRIAQSKCGNGNRTGLLALPVEDIIYQEIFPKLSIRDLLNLYDADQSKYADLVYGFLPKVEVLDLSMPCRDPRVRLTPCTIPDHHLQLMLNCVNVREVDFSGSGHVPHQCEAVHMNGCNPQFGLCFFQSVILKFKGLKILNLKNCNWLSIGCLQTIGLHLRNLEKLDISRNGQICLDKKTIWCFAQLTKLGYLNLEGNLLYKSDLVELLRSFPAIEILKFSFTHDMFDQRYDPSLDIDTLVAHSPSIKFMEMHYQLKIVRVVVRVENGRRRAFVLKQWREMSPAHRLALTEFLNEIRPIDKIGLLPPGFLPTSVGVKPPYGV